MRTLLLELIANAIANDETIQNGLDAVITAEIKYGKLVVIFDGGYQLTLNAKFTD